MIEEVTINDLATVVRGSSPRPKGDPRYYGGKVPRLMVADLTRDGKYVLPSLDSLTEEGAKKSRPMKKGDVIIAVSGNAGLPCILKTDACIHDGFVGLRDLAIDKIDKDYLYQLLLFNKTKNQNKAVGAIYKNLNTDQIREIKIPLPPLPIQKKIAAILDVADEYRQKTKALLEKYEQLTQSIFLDMFGDTWTNAKDWEVNSLGELTSKITDGTHKTPNYKDEGVIFLSAKNVKNCELNKKDCRFISMVEHINLSKRCNVEKGDILITKSGSLGMAAMVKFDFKFSIFESLALIKYKRDSINGTFLLQQLNTESNKFQYGRITKGVGVKHLHLSDLRKLNIICPPTKLQLKFEKKIKAIEKQRILLIKSIDESNNLFQSLLQKAFKGELVR